MKTVVILGKRTAPGSPKAQWPGCHLAGTTHSNQHWGKKFGPVNDWDSWWDTHPFDPLPWYAGIKRRRAETYRWYQTLPGPDQPNYRPLYLAELDRTIPAGVLFDTDRILKAFPQYRRWLTCQLDLMLAHYLLDGYEHIVLHGHGTKFELDHMVRHIGVLVWMTIAQERGVKVTIVPPSFYLGVDHPYGVSKKNWNFPIKRGLVLR